jgi:hypothetical protein
MMLLGDISVSKLLHTLIQIVGNQETGRAQGLMRLITHAGPPLSRQSSAGFPWPVQRAQVSF